MCGRRVNGMCGGCEWHYDGAQGYRGQRVRVLRPPPPPTPKPAVASQIIQNLLPLRVGGVRARDDEVGVVRGGRVSPSTF